MPVPLEKFVQQLEDSGILAGDTLKDFIPPNGSAKDATDLARELVRKKKLTRFQVEEVSKGKGKSLILGNYILMEQIGAGGMGQVFKARHRRMDRFVAVKLLPAAMTKDNAAIARFEREVKAAAKITHPNIVAAHDADCANGVHFLVMELVEGNDLSALVKKNGPFVIDQAVNYILQAARGLEAAHAEGIVHRDIKPANLLLDKKGTVKILDMGLARIESVGDAAPQAELTNTGTIMGTVDYMAPEQALDTKTADARADIYALGCSLYYLLTGKATYDGDSLMAKLLAHRDHPIPAFRTVRPEVPEQVQAIFTKMVAKKVDDRYQTMSQVIADLEGCIRGQNSSIGTLQWPAPPAESGMTDFFQNISISQTKALPKKKVTKPLIGKDQKTWLLIGGSILGVLILLTAIVISIKTKDGKLIVTVNESDAEVQVLDEAGKVEITRQGDKGPITISVDPGKHRLKVQKDGFEFFSKDFEIESGGKKSITAKLVPVEDKPALSEMKTASVAAGTKKPLFFQTTAYEPWAKEIATMPVEQQLEAVRKKLVELNPGFDGKLMDAIGGGTPTIKEGVVTELGFVTDTLTDISSVRALNRLTVLSCVGSGPGGGKLSDLSPLQGLPLSKLWISNNEVSDLSPLQGMPLTGLAMHFTQVSDLSPLRGMKLDHLNCSATKGISNLSPLQGMPLTHLEIEQTNVADLLPLKDMSLELLTLGQSQVSDLSPLKGMPLRYVNITGIPAGDLSPLVGMPLTVLGLDFKPERDTEILRSIKTLQTINGKPAAEFWKEVETEFSGKEEGFVQLFDGKSFTGWKISENPESWKIVDGAIVANGPVSHLFYVGDDKPFVNFELRVDVKTESNSNGGIYFHTKYQEHGFPKYGFEAQINNSLERDPQKTGSLYAVRPVTEKYVDDNVWFTETIIVNGKNIKIKINDKVVVDYDEPGDTRAGEQFTRKIDQGTFALQSHDPASRVHIKNIRVKRTAN